MPELNRDGASERITSMRKQADQLQRSTDGRHSHMANSNRRPNGSDPAIARPGTVLQDYGKSIDLPIGLSQKVRDESIQLLNQVLADTMTLRDLYKKHHWQVSGRTFYQLHLLFDKHYQEQAEVVDTLAERIQLLGGISIAMAADVAEETTIERPPRGREDVPEQISRLLRAHEIIMESARKAAKIVDDNGDAGTNDVLISDLLRLNELQTWFLAEHLVDLFPVGYDMATPEKAGTRPKAVERTA
jgi:starvation-inducible DNA-binding protein